MKRRRALGLVAAGLALLLVPGTALAARLWTVGNSPINIDLGSSVTVSLTVRDTGDPSGGSQLSCVKITLPAAFSAASVSIASVRGQSSGAVLASWQAVWPGGSVVVFRNVGKKFALVGSSPPNDTAVFQITGTASVLGLMTWSAAATNLPGKTGSLTCGSGPFPAATVLFTVLPTVLPTPSPTPSPSPSPSPTPRPTAPPTAEPTAAPTIPPAPSPSPAAFASGEPSPSTGPSESAVPGGPSGGGSSGGGGSTSGGGTSGSTAGPGSSAGATPQLQVGSTGEGGGAGGPAVAGLGSATVTALAELPGGFLPWAYPSIALTVPGLLLLLAIGAQGLGALAWLPIVRRNLGAFGFRRRREQDDGPTGD